MPHLEGDRFDTKADEIVGPYVGTIPGHDAANLRDAVAAALRDEQATLSRAMKKFAPDLADKLSKRWRDANNALDDFLSSMRDRQRGFEHD